MVSVIASVYLLFSPSQAEEAASILGPKTFCKRPGAREATRKIKDKAQEDSMAAANAAMNCRPLKIMSSSASTR